MDISTYIKNDCLIIDMKYDKDFEQGFFLTSDEHFDSKKCDRKTLKRHYQQAKDKGWKIMNFGDWYDCMGGKFDKRTSKKDIRPEYNEGWYFDEIRKDAVKFLKPFSSNLVLFSEGNHEISVKQRHEFSLTEQTLYQLNKIEGNNIHLGKYQGWMRFLFTHKAGGGGLSYDMFYTHGTGGNAPVTRGAIQSARRQDMVRADFYVSGHIHTSYELPRPTMYLNKQGNEKMVECEHLQLGTYKQSWGGAWESQKGFSPAIIGGRALIFYHDSSDANKRIKYKTYRVKK